MRSLTLTGGSSGASLVLGQGASGNITSTAARSGDYIFSLTNSTTTGNAASYLLGYVGAKFGGMVKYGPAFVVSTLQNMAAFSSTDGIALLPDASVASGGTSNIDFFTTGYSSAVKARFTSTGNLLIGTTTDMSGSGGLKVAGTTASTSTTSGSLQNAGGFGNAGTSVFGGLMTMTNPVSSSAYQTGFRLSSVAGSAPNSMPAVEWYSTSLGAATAAIDSQRISGSFASNLQLWTTTPGGTLTKAATFSSDQSLALTSTTPSTNTTTGALQVAGGVGVSGAGYFGGSVVGTSELRANSAASGRGWVATIASAGQTAFGVYQSGDSTNRFLINGAGDIYFGDGAGLLDVAFGRSAAGTGTFTGIIKVASTTASTLTTNGALVVTGGVGVGGAMNVGGAVAIGNTTSVAVAAASTHKVSILIGGVQYYLLASNV